MIENSVVLIFLHFCMVVVDGNHPYQCPSTVVSTFPVNKIILEEHRQYSRQLYQRMKLWQLQAVPSPRSPHHKGNGSASSSHLGRTFSLLETVMQVTKAACPMEFISHDMFLEGAMNAFHFLHDANILGESSRGEDDLIGRSLYERIHRVLSNCQENLPKEKFFFTGSQEELDCPNGLIRKICQQEEEQVPVCKRLRMRRAGGKGCQLEDSTRYSNFILDVVWSMVDLVHGTCFMDFRKADDLTAFHAWEQAMERLFSRKMRKYWYQPGMTMNEYQTILHPNLVQQMHNLEMCVEGLYYLRSNSRTPRLKRPPFTYSIFR